MTDSKGCISGSWKLLILPIPEAASILIVSVEGEICVGACCNQQGRHLYLSLAVSVKVECHFGLTLGDSTYDPDAPGSNAWRNKEGLLGEQPEKFENPLSGGGEVSPIEGEECKNDVNGTLEFGVEIKAGFFVGGEYSIHYKVGLFSKITSGKWGQDFTTTFFGPVGADITPYAKGEIEGSVLLG